MIPAFIFCQKVDKFELLSINETKCDHFFHQIKINQNTINVCDTGYVSNVNTSYGICFKINNLPLKLTDKVSFILNKNTLINDIAFTISSLNDDLPNIFSSGVNLISNYQFNGDILIKSVSSSMC